MRNLFLLGFLAVILYTLSQAPFLFGFLRWFALVPLLFIVSSGELSFRKKTLLLWLVVFALFLVQYILFFDLLPADWMGIEDPVVGFFIITVLWFIFAALLSLSALPLSLAHFSLYLFPFLWVFQEYISSWLYSLVTWGPGSKLGAHFSYGFLAYSSYTSDLLLYLAHYLGVYGLSFLIACVNVLVFIFVIRLRKASFSTRGAGVVLVGALVLFFEIYSPALLTTTTTRVADRKTLKVLALQGNNLPMFVYTAEYFQNLAREYEKTIRAGLAEHPETDIVLLPEGTQILLMLSNGDPSLEKDAARALFGEDKYRILVYGDYLYEGQEVKTVISGMSNDPDEKKFILEKYILMPLGEYQPYVIRFGASLFGQGEWFRRLELFRGGRPPKHPQKTMETRVGTISAVSCSEILSSLVYQDIAKDNPDIIFQQQRLAIFHGNLKTYKRMRAISQVRAAVLRKPIVGAVDGSGYSYMISLYGQVLREGGPETPYLYGEIPI